MSESFEIHSAQRDYTVEIGTGLLANLSSVSSIVVADAALGRYWPVLGAAEVIKLEAREERKTLQAVGELIEAMRNLGANRQSHLVAVGGGIVQDVATFAAASYMRGIEWTYYPTTLLGMVDSCIGGKSSINVGQYKNIAGNYHPPVRVVIDIDFVNSLPAVQRVAGLCEAVKICFASRDDAFDRYLALASGDDPIVAHSVAAVIALSLRTKKRFIEEDEFDQGVRLLLNFGHTFGHALEASSHFSISHGVAVGLGVLAAGHFSIAHKLVNADHPRLVALTGYLKGILAEVPDLARLIDAVDSIDALNRFKSDKKHRKGEYAMILIGEGGHLERRFLAANAETEGAIVRAFQSLREELHEVQ